MKKILPKAIYVLIITVSMFLFFSALWYQSSNGDTGFYSILFSLFVHPDGFSDELLLEYFLKCICPALLASAVLSIFLLYESKDKKKIFKIYPFSKKVRVALIPLLCILLLMYDFNIVKADDYILNSLRKTNLYDVDYVRPDTVKIEFPNTKRNLIYIYAESMETTYFSVDEGGAMKENLIPELYNLAKQNTNFSGSENIGGWPYISNTSWTTASLVAQSSGIALNIPLKSLKTATELKGLVTLYDILAKEGYYQAFMCGSDATFGGRREYFENHSVDKIYDYSTAVLDGIIPDDYDVWWGFEDSKLFEYAKKALNEIGKGDKPFSFTMLTADTHHIGGYACDKCEDKYEDNYSNVLACSSKQISEFIEWIKQQAFYENTTVIICGDHLSMDGEYFKEIKESGYKRYVYNCIINAPVSPLKNKNRAFSPMDMFPTSLAAMGCTIKGDHLGLGVNLYSDFPTLTELYSQEDFNKELESSSDYYVENFLK